MADWRLASRVLVAWVALILLVAASGEGCDEGSAAACPETENAMATVELAYATTGLAKSDLQEDLERARDIAQDVANATDGTCEWAKKGKGYKVAVSLTEDEDDDRVILVRVMARSRARDNYYRVIYPPMGAVDKDGEYSDRAEDTHHDISDDSVSEILDMIEKIKEREA